MIAVDKIDTSQVLVLWYSTGQNNLSCVRNVLSNMKNTFHF